MDWVIRFSFINDILNGMAYLYAKGLHCHSRLTSNCLFLDAQFTLKIGQYGLPSFFNLSVIELWFARKDPAFFVSLLWTPPEVLKDFDNTHGRTSRIMNPSVDVYSFGIILQELILWSRPFSMYPKLTAKGAHTGTSIQTGASEV